MQPNPSALVKMSDTTLTSEQQLEIAKVWPNSILSHPGPIGATSIGPITMAMNNFDTAEARPTPKQIEQLQQMKQAIKYDDGKVDWTLVPFEALEDMARVLQFGARKYAAWNWTEGGGFKWTRIVGSCLRHIFAFLRGEDVDPESGISHISHAQCNLLFLAYYIRNKEKFNKDDRNVK